MSLLTSLASLVRAQSTEMPRLLEPQSHWRELLAPVCSGCSRTPDLLPPHLSPFLQNSRKYHHQPGLALTVSTKATLQRNVPHSHPHSSFRVFSLPPPDSSEISRLVYELILSEVSSNFKNVLYSWKMSSPSHLVPFSEVMFWHL